MNIQDAVDVALTGDKVLVTNGLYATGGRAVGTNVQTAQMSCVAVDKPLTMSSFNGPDATIIDGLGTMRCVYPANHAVLAGFGVARLLQSYRLERGAYAGGLAMALSGPFVSMANLWHHYCGASWIPATSSSSSRSSGFRCLRPA